jgi:hypothetical protein
MSHDAVAADAKDADAPVRQPSVPARVAGRIVGALVYPAIHFDSQAPFSAEEVENPGAHWMLAAELQALKLASAKALPKAHLRRAHLLAELASAVDGDLRGVHGQSHQRTGTKEEHIAAFVKLCCSRAEAR